MSHIIYVDEQEDSTLYSLDEVCRRLLLDRNFVVLCVEHDIAGVAGSTPAEWIFTTAAVIRIHKAYRLHRDLDIHPESLALILELLDERAQLQQEVASLRRRLSHWELP
ncbi:MAG: hypothetical protein RLZZ227_2887 [Pseudomonadota bacterium]